MSVSSVLVVMIATMYILTSKLSVNTVNNKGTTKTDFNSMPFETSLHKNHIHTCITTCEHNLPLQTMSVIFVVLIKQKRRETLLIKQLAGRTKQTLTYHIQPLLIILGN